ncbi:hypothetical protein K1T71_008635 [Dendrolimus kikuchii]|uniref:Uncharacterized protein n=1 Tax=Dendrolimus kikuchii TaxID=765133 RepID=A0ACC1CV76_9NEOP|nr:hypothetical protein K1T71_008635 [Dendrolimus kikuchii]
MNNYKDLFTGIGKLPGKYRIIIDKNACPSICPVRKIPLGVREKLKNELDRMENMQIIRKVEHPTQWVNAIVLPAKKDGSFRICLDPRPLNRVIKRAHYPLPTLTEISTKLHNATYFSKLDARSGFWMVELDDESADLCTFGTPFGRYQFLRLPYGISCASEIFHAKIRQLLEGLDGVDSFVDDIIVWGESKSQHDERLTKLLEKARAVGIKFNRDKCEFCVEQITYLGHTFNKHGMQVDKEKLRAIKEMPNPKDKLSLERFLGMVNYLSKFIPNFSELSSPLRCLLKKGSEWTWDKTHESAVERLKEALCNAPVLAIYSSNQPVVVTVDASAKALGAALLQAGRPVEFASLTLSETQIRYAQIEKDECNILIKYILNGWPKYKKDVNQKVQCHWEYRYGFEYVDGILFKDNLVFIPKELRGEMLVKIHEGHLGIDRCKRRARDVMFWKGMSRQVENTVRSCNICAKYADRPSREPMLCHSVPDLPWRKVGSDIFTLRQKNFLLLVDYFSNFIEVSPLKSISTKAVVTAMKDQFARHGIPAELITDNGPAFFSKEFRDFARKWSFKHITSSPMYAQSNGLSERAVRTVKNILKKSLDSGTDFYLGLLSFRATPRDGIGSPSQLLMGRRLNTSLPIHENKLRPERNNSTDYNKIINNHIQSKKYYDKHAHELPKLYRGDRVVVADGQLRRHMYVEAPSQHPRSYFLTDESGKRYRRNRRHIIKRILPPSSHARKNDGDNNSPDRVSLYSDAEEDYTEKGAESGMDASSSDDNAPDYSSNKAKTRKAALQARDKLKGYFSSN